MEFLTVARLSAQALFSDVRTSIPCKQIRIPLNFYTPENQPCHGRSNCSQGFSCPCVLQRKPSIRSWAPLPLNAKARPSLSRWRENICHSKSGNWPNLFNASFLKFFCASLEVDIIEKKIWFYLSETCSLLGLIMKELSRNVGLGMTKC